MALHPTTSGGYPDVSTPEKERVMEEFAIHKHLSRHGILAHTAIRADGMLEILVVECLNAECSNVRVLVHTALRVADPERVSRDQVLVRTKEEVL